MKRGVVLSPDFAIQPDGRAFFRSVIDPVELRKYLLYWDKIDVPLSDYLTFGCKEFEFLEAAGVMERTRTTREGIPMGNIYNCTNTTLPGFAATDILESHELAFEYRSKLEPGLWSKAQLSDVPLNLGGTPVPSLDVTLANVLPVPSADTPLEAILDFKAKRGSELIAFQTHLDDLYQRVRAAPDLDRAAVTEMQRLQQAIDDLNRTMDESAFKKFFTSLRATMSSSDGIAGTAVGTLALQTVSVNPAVAAAATVGLVVALKMFAQGADVAPGSLTYLRSARGSGIL